MPEMLLSLENMSGSPDRVVARRTCIWRGRCTPFDPTLTDGDEQQDEQERAERDE